MEKVFEIYIKTTPERLWEAITDDEMRQKYSFGVGIDSDWTAGSSYESRPPGADFVIAQGENLEVDPPRRLVQSFNAMWSDDVRAEPTSRVTYEIEPVGDDSCRLTVTHDQLRDGAHGEIYGGWPQILSGLKTLLETGETLTTPGSLMYAQVLLVGDGRRRRRARLVGVAAVVGRVDARPRCCAPRRRRSGCTSGRWR